MPKYLDNLENITSDIQDYNKCILIIYDTYDTLSYSILDMIANYDEIKNYNLIITNKTNLKIDMLNKLNLNYFSQLHISQYYNIFTQINNLKIPKLFYQEQEGAVSCYIDAVTKKIGASSYSKNMIDLDYRKTLKEQFSKIKNMAFYTKFTNRKSKNILGLLCRISLE
jgi:hypothetical protein